MRQVLTSVPDPSNVSHGVVRLPRKAIASIEATVHTPDTPTSMYPGLT